MKKQSLIVLIIIVVLAVTMAMGYFFKSSKRTARKTEVSIVKKLKVNIKDIQSIGNIKINDIQLDYVSAGTWTYSDDEKNIVLPVDTEKVKSFLTSIQSLGQGRVVESNPKDVLKYSISPLSSDNPLGYVVTIYSASENDELLKFTMSKAGSRGAIYTQFQGDPTVYKVGTSLQYALSSDSKYWLNTNLFSSPINEDDVVGISIDAKDEDGFSLTKNSKKKNKDDNDSAWKVEGDDAVKIDDEAISKYITSFVGAQATNFSSVAVDTSMEEVSVTVTLKDESTQGLTLYSFADKYFVSVLHREEDYSFTLSKYLQDTIFVKSLDTFIAKDENVKEE